MTEIEDCFVKFYLQQGTEVEPDTIKALIENGFRTKLSLLAMDLTLDLPQMSQINLAQRAIVRRYIGALQEHSPFYLNIVDEAGKSYTSNEHEGRPNKKRKYDVFIEESGENGETLQNKPGTFSSPASSSSLSSKSSSKSAKVTTPPRSKNRASAVRLNFSPVREEQEETNDTGTNGEGTSNEVHMVEAELPSQAEISLVGKKRQTRTSKVVNLATPTRKSRNTIADIDSPLINPYNGRASRNSIGNTPFVNVKTVGNVKAPDTPSRVEKQAEPEEILTPSAQQLKRKLEQRKQLEQSKSSRKSYRRKK